MVEPIRQEFEDEIEPIWINETNGDGQIVSIVDWEKEANSRLPTNAINIQYGFTLEYLNFHYLFPTLNRIPTQYIPNTKLTETDTTRQVKAVEFKRKYTPLTGHAVQFILWRWFDGAWRQPHHSGRDYLYYLGIEGHIDVIWPYFRSQPGVMFGSPRHKIGVSIEPRSLQSGDQIEINGGYSGFVSYVLQQQEQELIEGNSGARNVSRRAEKVLNSNSNRAALYLCNGGNTRLYWKFTNDNNSIFSWNSPFLEPGESLSYEHGQFKWSGGNSHLLPSIGASTIVKLEVHCIRESGNGFVSWQELEFND